LLRRTIFAALLTLCGACEIASSWAGEDKREGAAAVLFVRQPAARTGAAGLTLLHMLTAPSRPDDGSEARPFPSLSDALEMAPAGALLRIEEGTWREKLEITRAVVLMGRGAGRTRIVPPEGTRIAVDVHGADQVQLHGLSIEGALIGAQIRGGSGHLFENVELRGQGESGLVGRQAKIAMAASSVREIGGGHTGRGIDVEGGGLEARHIVLIDAGRRALVVRGAPARLEDLEVRGSAGAVQALDGANVRVIRGRFEGQGGAAIYAGAARLSIEGAHLSRNEYGIIAARGAELSVTDDEVTDYRVAGVALVHAHGTVRRTLIAHGGTESAISITMADGKTPVLLIDNRIRDPGTMGVHITGSSVTAQGNTITGARLDREKDMGDAFVAIESKLLLEQNVMRGNAGSGIATWRSTVKVDGNGLIGNGRAGLLLLDRSRATATGNFFQRNALAAVELGEQARARLVRNRFEGNPRLDIDVGCEKGSTGTADLGFGNTFAAPVRRRACLE
jgi:hypothetical protein